MVYVVMVMKALIILHDVFHLQYRTSLSDLTIFSITGLGQQKKSLPCSSLLHLQSMQSVT